MKYMLQVRFNGAESTISSLPSDQQRAVVAEFEAITQTAGVLDGNQLQPATTAITVRVHNGQTQVTDGLLVDPSAGLDGYYLFNAPDIEAAIELAAQIPTIRFGATIEIRPVVRRG